MTRNRMRLLGALLFAGSLVSCVGTGWVPNRRDHLDELAWGGLFCAGLTLVLMAFFAFTAGGKGSTSSGGGEGKSSALSAVKGGLGGLVFGGSVGYKLGGDELAAIGAGVAMGVAAAGVLLFKDYVDHLSFPDAGSEP